MYFRSPAESGGHLCKLADKIQGAESVENHSNTVPARLLSTHIPVPLSVPNPVLLANPVHRQELEHTQVTAKPSKPISLR